MYDLGGLNLLISGFVPIQLPESTIALTGLLDMPARIGKTSHEWAGQNGSEPYVSDGEIFFGGRGLVLNGVVTGATPQECNTKINTIYNHINGLTGLVPLATDYGTYLIYVDAPVIGEYLPDAGLTKGIRLTIPMREPSVLMNGVAPISTGSPIGIDGISFADLGGGLIELSGDRRNRPAPKSETASAYGIETYLITKLVSGQLKLTLAIRQLTYAAMKDKVDNVMALFAAPGIRTITVPNDQPRSFFVKDGFKASKVYIKNGMAFCLIECNLTEVE